MYYIAEPFTFDIEVTSFKNRKGEKRAIMYIAMLCIKGDVIYFRFWNEVVEFFNLLKVKLRLNENHRIVIYIHNLEYEFQFLRGYFQISDVFARQERHPIRATMDNCFELRCSYMLSGTSLDVVAKNLTSHKINKMVGNLNYRKKRHGNTKLTDNEMLYCKNDVLILYYYIKEEIDINGDIALIPMTKTGYVRRYVREYLRENVDFKEYNNRINACYPSTDVFILLNKCFAGGYTHTNYIYTGDVLSNVHSIDFTSAYPANTIRHREYPIGKFSQFTIKSKSVFKKMLHKYACIFEVRLTNVRPKTTTHILQRSKCIVKNEQNCIVDNGRIMKVDDVITYMTNIDFLSFEEFYTYDDIYIKKFYYAKKGYLPTHFIYCVLKLYCDKTVLKGIKGKEQEYLLKKGMCNSTYGMCVTSPVNDIIKYLEDVDVWESEEPNLDDELTKNAKKRNNFLLYQWGVFITALSRAELYKGLIAIGNDVVYSDTDSIKFLNYDKHKKWISEYNKNCVKELEQAMNYHNLDVGLLHPKNKNGDICTLGIFDYEGVYHRAKFLGAKRYGVEIIDGKKCVHSITVSGLRKQNAVIFMERYAQLYKMDFFDVFTDKMVIPRKRTGKLCRIYIDDYFSETLIDYEGESLTVSENFSIYLEPTPFEMGLGIYSQFLSQYREIDERTNANNSRMFKRKELAINPIDSYHRRNRKSK
ncbi:MAG: hypothetical protein IJ371_01295 [Clostridia bacterium]|nr:hypothetical protein [Clostridia bacterium]